MKGTKNDRRSYSFYPYFGFNNICNNVFVFRLTITMKGKNANRKKM